MLAEQRHDRSALRWIRGELDQTLREARAALEDFVDGQQARLIPCVDALHHVQGALGMAQIYGGAMLADEMEQLALAMSQSQVKDRNAAAEALMLGMVQLPAYLERIESGAADIPLALLPVMNELRAARDSSLISETSLFAPKLDAVITAETVRPGSGNRRLPELIHAHRTEYHRAMLSWLKGGDEQAALAQIRGVLKLLRDAAGTARLQRLLDAADALARVLLEHDAPTKTVRPLFGKIDRVFKQITDQGEEAAMLDFPVELLKNLLYYVARSHSDDPAVVAVRQTADLASNFPEQGGGALGDSLGGPDRELFKAVGDALSHDLRDVKDHLDLYMRGDRAQVDKLFALMPGIQRIGDTLGMVGRGELRAKLKARVEQLLQCQQDDATPDDDLLMGMAGDLLTVESSLSDLALGAGHMTDGEEPMEGTISQTLSQGEMHQHVRAAIDEASVELAKAKETILDYLAKPAESERLVEIPARLHSVAGVMQILSLGEAARLLDALRPYVAGLAGGEKPPPTVAQRDALADVVVSAELYMQSVLEPGSDRQKLLDYATAALGVLGLDDGLAEPVEASPAGAQVLAFSAGDAVQSEEDQAATPQVGSDHVAAADSSIVDLSAGDETDDAASEPGTALEMAAPGTDLAQYDDVLDLVSPDAVETTASAVQERPAAEVAAAPDAVESPLDAPLPVQQPVAEADDELMVPDRPQAEGPEAASGAVMEAEQAVDATPAEPSADEEEASLDADEDAIDPEILEIFGEEAREELEVIQECYPKWRADRQDQESLTTMRRSFHTLKGSGRIVGANNIGEFAWAVENLLNRVIDGTVVQSDSLFGLLDDIMQVLPTLVEEATDPALADSDVTALAARADAMASGQPEPAAPDAEAAPAASAVIEPVADEPDVVIEPVAEEPDVEGAQAPLSIELEGPDVETNEVCVDAAVTTEEPGVSPVVAAELDLEPIDAADEEPFEWLSEGTDSISEAVEMAPSNDVLLDFEPVDEAPVVTDPDDTDDGQPVDAAETGVNEAGGMDAAADEVIPDESILTAVDLEDSEFNADDANDATAPDTSLYAVFLNEAHGHLQVLDEFVARGREQGTPIAVDEALQRAMHTLRGSARTTGVQAIAELAAELEMLVNELHDLHHAVDDQALSLLARSRDMLVALAEAVEQPGQSLPDWQTLRDEVAAFKAHLAQVAAEARMADTGQAGEEQPDDLDPELLEIFSEEAKELLEAMESDLVAWESAPGEIQPVHQLQRTLHTMKGGARLAGITTVGDLSHALESVFESITEQRISGSQRLQGLVRQATDALAQDVDQLISRGVFPQAHPAIIERLEDASHGREWHDIAPSETVQPVASAPPQAADIEPDVLDVDALHDDIETDSELLPESQLLTDSELLEEAAFGAPAPPAVTPPEHGVVAADAKPTVVQFPGGEQFLEQDGFVPRRPMPQEEPAPQAGSERVRVASDVLDQMVNNAGEVSIYRARLEQQNSTFAFNLGELQQTIERLRLQLRSLENETEAQVLARHEREADTRADFDPLELDRYSLIQQLSRALSETVEDLSNLGNSLNDLSRDTDTLLLQQARVTTDLQDSLLRTRMVRFSSRVPRLERVVRQTSQSVGKQAQLEVNGGGEDMDRAILERMMGPLEHLLRNAISHGIEDAATRQAKGKPARGVIHLGLTRDGSDVVLTLSDDGAGLDRDRIRAKAIERGLLEADAKIDDLDLYQLILEPGFSTAQELSQVAGRGVGMDVVLTEVKQLGGSLEIDSTPGQGTRFTIRLPFTLAITDALLVMLGEEIYAIPHTSMDGVVRVSYDELRAIYDGEQDSFRYDDRDYQVRYLGNMLGTQSLQLSDNMRWIPMLLVRSGDHRVAIQVDSLMGNRQIVVKSVGVQLSAVRWFTGGTILADGQIALILDVNALVRADGAQQIVHVEAPPAEPVSKGVSVMVVDDSITVRKVTSRLLERHNMEVVTAKDGVDAITMLQEYQPDVMLLDIEMPRMDGFELARQMQSTAELRHIPIIMITSRTGDKHRNRAIELGVKRYLGKPYQEADLLDNIYSVLAAARP